MPSVGLEPTISAGERPQTYALDRAATGTGDAMFTTAEKRRIYSSECPLVVPACPSGKGKVELWKVKGVRPREMNCLGR